MANNYEHLAASGEASNNELACPRCRCDLTGMHITRCPECGVYFDAATMSRRRRRLLANACWSPERARWVVGIAGLSLLPLVWMASSITSGQPTWWKPFPLVFCLATVVLGSQVKVVVLAAVVVVGSFWLYAWPLMKGQPRIGWWSIVTFAFLHSVNGLYLLAKYSDGVETQGAVHTNLVCIITAGLFLALVLLASLAAWRPNFLLALAFHWIAWFWLVLYLFPLLGPFMTLV